MDFDFQGVMLDLIEHSITGGKQVRAALDMHRNLWQSCLITRINQGLILRDLTNGDYNVDTLYIFAAPEREKELVRLARMWHASDVRQISGHEARTMLGVTFDENPEILEVWWE